MTTLAELRQRSQMFEHFLGLICATPHPSGYEAALLSKIGELVQVKGLEVRRDEAGNLAFLVPGRGKYAGTTRALLCQCHADMVPAKTDAKVHDFLTDPIEPILSGGWLLASDTTLGADNGLGIGVLLSAAFDDTLENAPFVVLLTVREETDMFGAQNLDLNLTFPDKVTIVGGLNLDAEEGVEEVFIGCAGGTTVTATKLRTATGQDLAQVGYTGFALTVSGLSGGHSGTEIDKCHQNAVRLAVRFLQQCQFYSFVLCDGKGGTKMNRIPSSCTIRGFMDTVEFERMSEELPRFLEQLQTELVEADVKLEMFLTAVDKADLPEEFWEPEESRAIIDYLFLLSEGLLATDQIVAYKLPRTSSNLGIFTLDTQRCELTLLVRSSVDGERDLTVQRITRLGECFLFESVTKEGFKSWRPDAGNRMLLAAEHLWVEALGCSLQRMVTHGGLECGELSRRLKGVSMISMGGVIKRAHEPDESANVESWLKIEVGFMRLLEHLIEYVPE